jgi:hypothetical protein
MSETVLSRLKKGGVPLQVRQSAARGVLPVGHEELLAILIYLQNDAEPEVCQNARSTLEDEFSESLLKTILESPSAPAEILEYYGSFPFRSETLLEVVIQNKVTPDSTIAAIAEQVDAGLIDLILVNLMRLLRSPFILEALERNSHATPDITRRLGEIREEFFEKRNNFIPIHRTRAEEKAMKAQMDQEEASEKGDASFTYSGEIREGEDAASLTLESLADDGYVNFEEMPEDEKLSTIQKIARMSVAERVQTALKGSREERIILIRDSNRIVSASVLECPKLTDSEVEAIALMKNVSEEILRLVGTRREFAKSYSVIHNLVRNPRTPVATSLGMLNRILTNDLRTLSRNRNVPEVIRKAAQRQVTVRTAPKESKY